MRGNLWKSSLTGCSEVNAFTHLVQLFYSFHSDVFKKQTTIGTSVCEVTDIVAYSSKMYTQFHPNDTLECSCITNFKIFPVLHLHIMIPLGVATKRKLLNERLLQLGFQALLSQLDRRLHYTLEDVFLCTHQAAPTTDNEMLKPMPRLAHIKGEVSVRNLQGKESGWRL